jgi:hypothetical protein
METDTTEMEAEMATKTWVSERREWITTVMAGLALAVAIAALAVGLAAGGSDGPARTEGFGVGGPPQGMVAPGQTMPPGMPAGPGSQGYPDSGSGSATPPSGNGN